MSYSFYKLKPYISLAIHATPKAVDFALTVPMEGSDFIRKGCSIREVKFNSDILAE